MAKLGLFSHSCISIQTDNPPRLTFVCWGLFHGSQWRVPFPRHNNNVGGVALNIWWSSCNNREMGAQQLCSIFSSQLCHFSSLDTSACLVIPLPLQKYFVKVFHIQLFVVNSTCIKLQSLFYMLAELCRCKYSWAPANMSGLHLTISIGLGTAFHGAGFTLDEFAKSWGASVWASVMGFIKCVSVHCSVT